MKKRQKIKTMARNESVTAIHSPMVSRQMRLFSQREARACVATLYLRPSSAAQPSDFAPLSALRHNRALCRVMQYGPCPTLPIFPRRAFTDSRLKSWTLDMPKGRKYWSKPPFVGEPRSVCSDDLRGRENETGRMSSDASQRLLPRKNNL